jgi:hypothetical protein
MLRPNVGHSQRCNDTALVPSCQHFLLLLLHVLGLRPNGGNLLLEGRGDTAIVSPFGHERALGEQQVFTQRHDFSI